MKSIFDSIVSDDSGVGDLAGDLESMPSIPPDYWEIMRALWLNSCDTHTLCADLISWGMVNKAEAVEFLVSRLAADDRKQVRKTLAALYRGWQAVDAEGCNDAAAQDPAGLAALLPYIEKRADEVGDVELDRIWRGAQDAHDRIIVERYGDGK